MIGFKLPDNFRQRINELGYLIMSTYRYKLFISLLVQIYKQLNNNSINFKENLHIYF